jgi:peptide methionine sulfoxide reductase msrA/msrB
MQAKNQTIQVFYDPEKVTYEQLLDVFWRHVDPTDLGFKIYALCI